MSKRQQSKRTKRKCMMCGTTYDPARCKAGCPSCQRERINRLMAEIRRSGK